MGLVRLAKLDIFKNGLKVFRNSVDVFEKEFILKNRMPQAKNWRPSRMCIRDMVVSLVVLRKNISNNTIEVKVCAIDNVSQFEKHYSTMVALSVILSEAFKCSTSMEVKFLREVENGTVPLEICNYAKKIGLQLGHVDKGVLLPSESRLLYLSVTEFSRSARDVVVDLHKSGNVSLERICYMVHQGIWKREEMESILLSHPYPASLILGKFPPEMRIPYLFDASHACMAILGGALDRVVRMRQISDEEDCSCVNDREVAIGFEPSYYVKIYRSMNEDIPIPWSVYGGDNSVLVAKRDFVFARLLPHETHEFSLTMLDDLNLYVQRFMPQSTDFTKKHGCKARHFFVVSSDFKNVDEKLRIQILSFCVKYGIAILIFPYAMKFLNEQSFAKIDTSRRLRR